MTPFPGPRSVLLVDNCRIHAVDELVARVQAFGARVIFLEPYDPQHMPIEVGFRALKRCATLTPAPPPLPSISPTPSLPFDRWIRKHRDLLQNRPVHEQMRLAAQCISAEEAVQAFAASGY